MNNFFVNKVNDLRARIPPCRNSPLDRVRKLMEKRTCKFELQIVHPDVISEVIKNMKSSKSCGIDFIDSYILKLASDELTPGITHIVNLSIMCQHFPSIWKKSKVIPLFKKEDPTIAKNYRPCPCCQLQVKFLKE